MRTRWVRYNAVDIGGGTVIFDSDIFSDDSHVIVGISVRLGVRAFFGAKMENDLAHAIPFPDRLLSVCPIFRFLISTISS
jgi:hypothetical protein